MELRLTLIPIRSDLTDVVRVDTLLQIRVFAKECGVEGNGNSGADGFIGDFRYKRSSSHTLGKDRASARTLVVSLRHSNRIIRNSVGCSLGKEVPIKVSNKNYAPDDRKLTYTFPMGVSFESMT